MPLTTIARALAVAGLALAALIGTTTIPATAAAQDTTWYTLVGLGSNKCVDIRNEDADYGARAQLWQCYGSPNQRFTLRRVGTTPQGKPYFQIINKEAPYLCLQVRDNSTANGAQVDQYGCSADNHQYWYWGSPNNGVHLPLVNLNSGKCLDVNAGATHNGARIQQWTCNATAAQMWRTSQ